MEYVFRGQDHSGFAARHRDYVGALPFIELWLGTRPRPFLQGALQSFFDKPPSHPTYCGIPHAYGWPRMWKELQDRDVRVGKERIRRLIKLHGIQAKGKKKFVVTTDSKHNLPIADNLLARNFTLEAPN